MSSHKKGSGAGAVQTVERAMRRLRCDLSEFLRRAGVRGREVGEHADKIKLLKEKGPAAVPGYKMPKQVIDFAAAQAT